MPEEKQERVFGEVTVPVYDVKDKMILKQYLGEGKITDERTGEEEAIEICAAIPTGSLIIRLIQSKQIFMIKMPDLVERGAYVVLEAGESKPVEAPGS